MHQGTDTGHVVVSPIYTAFRRKSSHARSQRSISLSHKNVPRLCERKADFHELTVFLEGFRGKRAVENTRAVARFGIILYIYAILALLQCFNCYIGISLAVLLFYSGICWSRSRFELLRERAYKSQILV